MIAARRGASILLFLILIGLSWPAAAQEQPSPEQGGSPPAAASTQAGSGKAEEARQAPIEKVAPDSPRASLKAFLDRCREGKFSAAAQFLAMPEDRTEDAELLARRLKAVLDQHLWFDLALISPESQGDLDDDLPPATERIGEIPRSTGPAEPVLLVRANGDHPRWVFSADTVARIDVWFGELRHALLIEHLPGPLLKMGPRNIYYWQWVALPLVLILSWILGRFASYVTRLILGRLATRTAATWDDVLFRRLAAPMTLAWTIVFLRLAVPWMELVVPAEEFIHAALRTGLFVAFFWAAERTIDVISTAVTQMPWIAERSGVLALVPILARILKVAVGLLAIIAILSDLGYPVASLLAGLGLGGLAFALAAQKTLENVFGSLAIGVDQPFREGDFVRVDDFVGTVEKIGLRSTRIRTLDRTLVSLPNGRLADMRLETFAARDRIRMAHRIGVEYSTTGEQMRRILEGIEEAIRSHPRIWPDTVVVRFTEFGDSALIIDVMCWFQTTDFNEFRGFQQETLLRIMEVVEKAGTGFAFPTRTVHLIQASDR